ncbi:iron-containing alcohol dehydrogenase [Enterovirga rhinocerotis]|uniref:Alcohol dehydrogenase 2 n=1 Tax=Enterovirga rhinocerotis TaxID=1339210 RepID=A0A4R7C8V6_9HYPH|nr:iron-containing alcohol dehydrogenase [Enterovirga rhinocerotis]TDR93306.1 alcohol dehydrogenase [Enterovirga rhinocerotis]
MSQKAHLVMLLAQSSYFCPTRIVMGSGSYKQLDGILADFAARKVLLTIDPALVETAFVADVLEMLRKAGAGFEIFSNIEPDPSDTSVAEALDLSRALGSELVLAIGGGSTIDVAKAVAIVSTNGGRIHDYEGIEKFSVPPLPLIAVPTTAGTGSEVSGSCVISDTQRGLKMSIRHASLNPARVAILDPLALRTVPTTVAAHSGLDAFVHAFESYISRNANPFTDAVNLHALRLISANIGPLVANPENAEAALAMLTGSALAGMAFGQTGLGNVHCMARFVGAKYHIPHGLSNALCLPVVARFNAIANPAKYVEIARAMGCHVEGLSQTDGAQAAVVAIQDLCAELGIPRHLADVGVKKEHIPELAELCVRAGYNRWNPRTTSKRDFERLFAEGL